MTIKAIIEKGEDGLYAVRSESKIGRSFLGGFGESVEEARKDFEVSMLEAIEDAEKMGMVHPSRNSVKIEFRYDLPSFFNYFDVINTTKFAAYAGINESKMRQYRCGLAYPGEKTTNKILAAIKKIGAELAVVAL